MVQLQQLLSGTDKLSVVGLGYVGLPIAVAFARHVDVLGYDLSEEKVARLRAGVDPTREVGDAALAACGVDFTADPARLREARFHIVAVPTPVRRDKMPDLTPLESASAAVGRSLRPGAVVVYESTVYPGVTEEVCIPILERASGLVCGRDFFVGYSPERINPGDAVHRLETIVKIVSGMDAATLELVAGVYALVAEAGVHRASSIRVAEAAKVIENCQRDLNIAFVNELSLIFSRMGIDTLEVLEAAGTKWNFLHFRPGLVGGHCIGVDPYYLTYCAEQLGYHSQVILAGRRINDSMGVEVAQNVIKQMARGGIGISGVRVAVLGFTFKENCPDTRNTRVIDIVQELREYGIDPLVHDPVADAEELRRHYGIESVPAAELHDLDALIVAVAHDAFHALDAASMLRPGGLLADIKGILGPLPGHPYWRL